MSRLTDAIELLTHATNVDCTDTKCMTYCDCNGELVTVTWEVEAQPAYQQGLFIIPIDGAYGSEGVSVTKVSKTEVVGSKIFLHARYPLPLGSVISLNQSKSTGYYVSGRPKQKTPLGKYRLELRRMDRTPFVQADIDLLQKTTLIKKRGLLV